jgi:hypothetical protein
MLENATQLTADQQAIVETFGPFERDPEGRPANVPGAKLDHGKNRLALLLYGFPHAIEAVGRVATFGAEKYSPHGWRSVPGGFERYTDAMLRHLFAEGRGELIDHDSKLSHASAVAWNALARLELLLTGKGMRPPAYSQNGNIEPEDSPSK